MAATEAIDAQASHDRLTRGLLAGGVIGPILFVVVMLIEGATRPGYNAWVQAGSALSLSGWGWMQIASFILCGVLIVGLAGGLRWVLVAGGRGATWGPRLIAAVGLALVVAGVFVTDPAQGYPPGTPPGPSHTTTWHGALHAFAGGLIFVVLLPAACYVMAAYFARVARSRGGALYSLATGIVIWASFAAFITAGLGTGPAGLFERIAILAGWGWLALLAAWALRLSRLSSVAALATSGPDSAARS